MQNSIKGYFFSLTILFMPRFFSGGFKNSHSSTWAVPGVCRGQPCSPVHTYQ